MYLKGNKNMKDSWGVGTRGWGGLRDQISLQVALKLKNK
jgi:hypothetical protein